MNDAMLASNDKPVRITINGAVTVSALLRVPKLAKACFVFAHGAGAGMTHAFMQQVSEGLADRQVATLRYQFPYAERGSKRPDPPAVAHAAVRVACLAAGELTGLPLYLGKLVLGCAMVTE